MGLAAQIKYIVTRLLISRISFSSFVYFESKCLCLKSTKLGQTNKSVHLFLLLLVVLFMRQYLMQQFTFIPPKDKRGLVKKFTLQR